MVRDARVLLWGTVIGAVSWIEDRRLGVFQYTPPFVQSGIQPAPLVMPLSGAVYEYPELDRGTFKGLPGLLADSLPDRFGNALINTWLAGQGRNADSFSPVERLCYVGKRGMGALEFEPAILDGAPDDRSVDLERLAHLAAQILEKRLNVSGTLASDDDGQAMRTILRVGTSAGGARAKAILAWNPTTGEFRSGQGSSAEGFEHWLLKFDGVSGSSDPELVDSAGYGRIEFAYHRMAVDAGILMAPCRLHEEGGRSHFMTRRFDRSETGDKLHMQSLGGMAHFDFRQPASYSYEQAIQVMRRLGLPRRDLEQMVARAFFNVVARNCDDHVKNIAFLMDRAGSWSLSPAFDITYAWNPSGEWTSEHQMSVNGKRDGFAREDLLALAEYADIKRRKAIGMLDRVVDAVRGWPDHAAAAGVEEERIRKVQSAHRLGL